ncbi:MAG: M64 family metallopeptidase [Terriglobales bacterium]
MPLFFFAKGYYRPEVDCIMFTWHIAFCAVCRRAIERVIGCIRGEGRVPAETPRAPRNALGIG